MVRVTEFSSCFLDYALTLKLSEKFFRCRPYYHHTTVKELYEFYCEKSVLYIVGEKVMLLAYYIPYFRDKTYLK